MDHKGPSMIRSGLSKDEKDCSFKACPRGEYLTDIGGPWSRRPFVKAAVEPNVAQQMF